MNEALGAAWRHFVDKHAHEDVTVLAAAMFEAGARWAAAEPSRGASRGHAIIDL